VNRAVVVSGSVFYRSDRRSGPIQITRPMTTRTANSTPREIQGWATRTTLRRGLRVSTPRKPLRLTDKEKKSWGNTKVEHWRGYIYQRKGNWSTRCSQKNQWVHYLSRRSPKQPTPTTWSKPSTRSEPTSTTPQSNTNHTQNFTNQYVRKDHFGSHYIDMIGHFHQSFGYCTVYRPTPAYHVRIY
jgi:hypothetical protein